MIAMKNLKKHRGALFMLRWRFSIRFGLSSILLAPEQWRWIWSSAGVRGRPRADPGKLSSARLPIHDTDFQKFPDLGLFISKKKLFLNYHRYGIFLNFNIKMMLPNPSHILCICPCLQDIWKDPDSDSSEGVFRDIYEKPLHTYAACIWHGYQTCLRMRHAGPNNRGLLRLWLRLSGKYHDSKFNPGWESCPISKDWALLKKITFQITLLHLKLHHASLHIA